MAKSHQHKSPAELTAQAWRTHNDINLLLIDAIPAKGLQARTDGSKGRTVAEQLVHMARVRKGWLIFQQTGKRAKLPPAKDTTLTKAQIKKLFRESGGEVATFLREALSDSATVRYFGKNPFRWLMYLVSHESHHRGQILIALRQCGFPLSEEVRLNGLWQTWIFGKDE